MNSFIFRMIPKFFLYGLPIKSVGNGGQGGADRRGMDEPNKRPASVKASLSVGFKQRAPNRKNAFESAEGRAREGVVCRGGEVSAGTERIQNNGIKTEVGSSKDRCGSRTPRVEYDPYRRDDHSFVRHREAREFKRKN